METMSCPDCYKRVDEEDLFCPFCGAELIEGFEDDRDLTEDDFDEVMEEQSIGPEPFEYKWVRIAAVVLFLGALLWGWLSHS